MILFHAGLRSVPGGFLGVDVFFVLSGFLITGILIAEIQRTGTVSLPRFWGRRIRRLLPAATLVSVATLLLSAALDSPFAERTFARSAIAFATYWSNLLFVRRGADYFDRLLASDPYLHTWSLAVEEQYYLIFAPICFFLAATARGGHGLFRHRLFWITVVVSILSFAGGLILTPIKPLISFYTLPTRAWEFGIGGILAIWASRGTREPSRWDSPLSILAVLGLVASFLTVGEQSRHPGWITLAPVLATAALIHVGGRGPTLVGRGLASGVMRTLGRLSYSWYLWHWPLTIYWNRPAFTSALPLAVGMPLVSLALAQLTYVTVEAPARYARWLQSPRRGLVTAAVLALVTSLAGIATIWHAGRRLADPAYAFILEARDTRTRLHADGCHLEVHEVEPKSCAYANTASDTVVALFGDSHAAQWFAALEPVAAKRGWRLVPLTKSGCPSISVTVWMKEEGRAFSECDRWRLKALERLTTLSPAVVVIANSHWLSVLDTAGTSKSMSPPPSNIWRQGLRQTLSALPAKTAILLLEDTPKPGFDVPTCLFEHIHDVARCAFRRDSAIVGSLSSVLREASRDDPRVTYADLNDHICGQAVCDAAVGNVAHFSDADHLSVRFAASLSKWLLPILGSMGPRAPGRSYLFDRAQGRDARIGPPLGMIVGPL